MASPLKTKPSRPRRRSSSTQGEPFDVLLAIAALVARIGLTLDALQRVDAAAMLEEIARSLADDLADTPPEQRPAIQAAAFTGYVAALATGLQLGGQAVENWRRELLEMAERAHACEDLDARTYGYFLGLLCPEGCLILPEDAAVH